MNSEVQFDVAAAALADERNFIDHARSAFHVYQSAPEPAGCE
jgi:hypothetical protein